MPLPSDPFLAASTVLAARALLQRTCEALAAADIVPVVLKGVVLSALMEGSGAAPRPMSDVDLLVKKSERRIAEPLLRALGLKPVASTMRATTFYDESYGMYLDLHSALTPPEMFDLDAEALLARSVEDTSYFGFPVKIPDRSDFYAHLVAHFVLDRSSWRDRRRIGDFAIVARYWPMSPEYLASRLRALGLTRAARYVLTLLGQHGDAFATEVRRYLAPDVTGELLARAAWRWSARFDDASIFAAPFPHLLNTSLARGSYSFSMHCLRGGRDRALRWLSQDRGRVSTVTV